MANVLEVETDGNGRFRLGGLPEGRYDIHANLQTGGSADPASAVASTSMTAPFAALAVVGLVPLTLLLRRLDGDRS